MEDLSFILGFIVEGILIAVAAIIRIREIIDDLVRKIYEKLKKIIRFEDYPCS